MDESRQLSIATSLCSTVSMAFLLIAISTDYWLYTTERTPDFNGTVFLSTYSGLWRKCVNDLSLRRAVVFPLMSTLLSICGEALCLLSHCRCSVYKMITYVVVGFLNVLGGLFIFVGMTMYIGAVTEEASNRSKPSPPDETVSFHYDYGPSLTLMVSAFFVSEMTGVLAMQLHFVLRRQLPTKHQDPCADHAAAPTQPSLQQPEESPTPPADVKSEKNSKRSGDVAWAKSERRFTVVCNSNGSLVDSWTLRTTQTRRESTQSEKRPSNDSLSKKFGEMVCVTSSRRNLTDADSQRYRVTPV